MLAISDWWRYWMMIVIQKCVEKWFFGPFVCLFGFSFQVALVTIGMGCAIWWGETQTVYKNKKNPALRMSMSENRAWSRTDRQSDEHASDRTRWMCMHIAIRRVVQATSKSNAFHGRVHEWSPRMVLGVTSLKNLRIIKFRLLCWWTIKDVIVCFLAFSDFWPQQEERLIDAKSKLRVQGRRYFGHFVVW